MKFLKKITVEPVMFLQQTGDTLTYVIYQNLFIDKICKIDLGYGKPICDLYEQSTNISEHEFLKPLMTEIQTTSSQFSMYNSLVENSFPVLLVLFLGVWSDQQKRRKPTLLLSLVGKLIRTLGLLLNAYFINWPSYILLITAALPHSLGGGNAVFQMSAFSYISDASKPKSRTWRICIVEAFWYLGSPVGLSLGAYLYQVGGYLCVFGTSFICHLIGVLYAIFILPEIPSQMIRKKSSILSKKNYGTASSDNLLLLAKTSEQEKANEATTILLCTTNNNNNEQEPKSLLTKLDCPDTTGLLEEETSTDDESPICDLIIGSAKSIVIWRPHHLRECLLSVSAVMLLYFAAGGGESAMKYLFTRNKFGWREQQFSLWTIFEAAVSVIGLTIVMPIFTKVFKLSDPLVGVFGAVSRASSRLCYALAPTSLYFYVGSSLDAGGVLTGLAARSLASKCVPRSERGRIFAILGCLEALIPFVAVPLYTFIYTQNLKFTPSAIYYTSASIYLIIIIIFSMILTGLKLKFIRFSDTEINPPQ